MKRAKQHRPPAPAAQRKPVAPPLTKPRNPVARSPLLRKGGPHGKTTAAKRRAAKIALGKLAHTGDGDE